MLIANEQNVGLGFSFDCLFVFYSFQIYHKKKYNLNTRQ